MAGLLGVFIGSTIAMLLLTLLVGRFAYRSKEPSPRALATVLTAYAIAFILSGIGRADGGPFAWWAGFDYIPGALIAWAWYRHRLQKAWTPDAGVFE